MPNLGFLRADDGQFVRLEFSGDDVRNTDVPRFGSVSGYGARQPSGRMVKYAGRWHRVYVAIYSNNGTAYIRHAGRNIIVQDCY